MLDVGVMLRVICNHCMNQTITQQTIERTMMSIVILRGSAMLRVY